MKVITVCVEYDDLLAITLPGNAPLFEKILVVTAPHDLKTPQVVASVPNAQLYVTSVFYENDCPFNKAAALEEGFDVLGRDGWLMMLDADIVLPIEDDLYGSLTQRPPGAIHGPRRHMVRDPLAYTGQPWRDWDQWPIYPEPELAGCCVIFHAADPVLAQRPWLDTRWKHAGGYDSFFQQKWHRSKRLRTDFNVLHLGEDGANWYGRCTTRLDGEVPEQADQRRADQQRMYRQRQEQNGFDKELLE